MVQYNTGDDFSSGGDFLEAEGWFLFTIREAEEPPLDKDNVPLANGIIGITAEVLWGTAAGQLKKISKMRFFEPKFDQSEKAQAFVRKQFDRFLMAVGMIDPGAVNQTVQFEKEELLGRVFFAKFHHNKPKGRDKGFWQVDGARYYHVDDPEVAHLAEQAGDILKRLPANWRRKREEFEQMPAPPPPKPQPAMDPDDF